MARLYNLARMFTNSVGSGLNLKLTSAVPPFLTFDDAGVQNGEELWVSINDFVGANSLEGTGVYTAAGTTLLINSIKRSSGAAHVGMIPLSGQAQVAIEPAAEFFAGTFVGTMRLPAPAASVTVLTTDIELGIDTTSTAVNANLPTATAWAAANPNGLDLALFDYTGHADTHNITPVASGSDIFIGGITPLVQNAYGLLRLRPVPGVGWYLRQ